MRFSSLYPDIHQASGNSPMLQSVLTSTDCSNEMASKKLTKAQKEALSHLNEKRKLYVINRVKGLERADAYIKAGYSATTRKNASSNAKRLEENEAVKYALEVFTTKRDAERMSKAILSRNNALQILSSIANVKINPDATSTTDILNAIKLITSLEAWEKAGEKDQVVSNTLLDMYSMVSGKTKGRPPCNE